MEERSGISGPACVSSRKMKLRVRQFLLAAAFLAQALLTEGKGKDYYSTLGLKKNAKEAAIKKAYRCVCCELYRQSLPALLLSAAFSYSLLLHDW